MRTKKVVQSLRNQACNICPDPWYIAGAQYSNGGWGGGILEWCYTEDDAREELARLKTDNTGQYKNLSIGLYSRDWCSE